MNKHIQLAQKLKALSEKGVGGEKENAENMLRNLMAKHGITESDLDFVENKEYFFNVTTEYFWLFHQVVKSTNRAIKIYGRFPKKYIKSGVVKANHMIECTPPEFIEVEAKWSIFLKLYKKEYKVFQRAFCSANDLLVTTESKQCYEELSAEDKDIIFRAEMMAANIDKQTYRKQIENIPTQTAPGGSGD